MSAVVSLLPASQAETLASYVGLVPSFVYLGAGGVAPAGAPSASLESLLTDADRALLDAEAEARAASFRAALAADAFEGAPLAASTIRDAVDERLVERLSAAMRLVASLDAAHARTPLELVILSDDLTLVGRTVAEWGRANGVPSVVVSHSCILGRLYTVHAAVNADAIVVYGERGAQAYRDVRIDPARVIPLANPAWGRVRLNEADRRAARAAVRAEAGWGADDPVVVFGTTWAANLTAFCDPQIEERSLRAIFAAVAAARATLPNLRLLVKGRTADRGAEIVRRIGAEYGVDAFGYAVAALDRVFAAGDVVVSTDSNLSIEATIAGLPAVNLWTPMTMTAGPFFASEDGVLEVPAERLAAALVALVADPDLRAKLVAQATQRLAALGGVPGPGAAPAIAQALAARRTVTTNGAPSRAGRYVWEDLSRPADERVNDVDAQYHRNVRSELFPLLAHAPKVVLEIGCAGGGTSAALKQQYGAFAVGVESNPAVARVAAERLDAVVSDDVANVEAIRAALGGRSVDTLILADVLEHLYDPWSALVKLRTLLAPDAQVIASIPNTRNLVLMNELAGGRWTYESEGLLDVTHIRFFTLGEIAKMFAETGYRIEAISRNHDARTGNLKLDFTGTQDIRAGRITIHGVTAQELTELATIQFLIRARVA